jgi:hypothetical protein
MSLTSHSIQTGPLAFRRVVLYGKFKEKIIRREDKECP